MRKRRNLDALAAGPSKDWGYLLTAKQRGYNGGYCEAMSSKRGVDARLDERRVFDLGQRPHFTGVRSVGEVPVIRRSGALLWSPCRRRWMTPKEQAGIMGFPVSRELAQASRTSLDELTTTCPSAVGNAMHVANLGVVILAVMASAEWS